MFEEIKNRDAWSTLRGFVYQVDTTIMRWLELKDNEILELEKGEDIDIITHDFENNEISRELEQVKYREANITLNQEITFEILFNFYIQKKNNPDNNILFRFITNTNYSTERPALFIDGKSGIEVWIELRNSKAISKSDERYIAIKNHLIKKANEKVIVDLKKPTDEILLEQQGYKDFIAYIENDENLIKYISDFEWSFGNDDHNQISESIKRKIIECNILSDANHVNILYSRLFLYIFKILCNRGLKSISKSELSNQALLKELSTYDQNILNTINELINNIQSKIIELEGRVTLNTVQISSLLNDIKLINNSDSVFEYGLKNISTKPPIFIKNGTLRKEKVSEIINIFNTHTWINFQGINGTGKSQLASLVCIEFDNYWWLDLRAVNDSIEKSTLLIEVFFSTISNCPVENNRHIWVSKIINSLPSNTIIVLNDLPKAGNNSTLSYFLVLIANNIKIKNIKLLTTSNFKISDSTKEGLDLDIFKEYQDFNFSKNEIIECLINNGAEESIVKHINLIETVSQSNPRLVNAIISHLKKLNWGKDSMELFDTLFNKEFSNEILQDSQQAVKRYIKDENQESFYID